MYNVQSYNVATMFLFLSCALQIRIFSQAGHSQVQEETLEMWGIMETRFVHDNASV